MQNNYMPMQSISTSKQPHRFFERFLDNDLDVLVKELQARYSMIENAELDGVTPVGENEAWKSSNSVSTMKWRQYNVFQFHIPGIRNLYDAVSEMVHEACDYYELDFKKQEFMLQGWFNINYSHSGKLDWHEHGPNGAPNFHGYYAVKAEPSETHYITTNQERKINVNIDNRAVLSEMGHPHAMGDWTWDGPRITVAYDVMPLRSLIGSEEQHWLPLA
jgi:pullulanase/glycogen debranching enzyme